MDPQTDLADFETLREFRELRRMRGREDVDSGLQQPTGLPALPMPFAAPTPVPLAAPSPVPGPPLPPEVAALAAHYGLTLMPQPAQAPPALLPQLPEGGHQPDDHK